MQQLGKVLRIAVMFSTVQNEMQYYIFLALCLPGHENFGYFWLFFDSRLTIVYYEQQK